MADLDKTLWCVNIQGPDDLIATVDHLSAVKVANTFNQWWQAQKEKQPQRENDPRMWAVPIEWPWDADLHAASVSEPGEDYIWLVTLALAGDAVDQVLQPEQRNG